MLAIWIMRTAGIPVFGEPVLDEPQAELLESEALCVTEGIVLSRREREESTQYLLKNVSIRGDRPIQLSRLQLNTEEANAIPIGAVIRCIGDVKRIASAGNPGQFDARAYYASQKVYYRIWSNSITVLRDGGGLREALARIRERMVAALCAHLPERAAGVLTGMLLGERSLLTDEVTRNYQVGGLFHIIAISGMHISLLGMGLYRILLRVHVPGKAAAVAAMITMVLYCLLIGTPVSAIRACIMFGVSLSARMLRRSYDLWSSLAFAGILILLWNPGAMFLAAYQLSFSAVIGMGYVGPIIEELVVSRTVPWFLLNHVIRPAMTYFAVTLVTLPLIAWHYYEIPLLGLVCNLLIVPFVGFILGTGAFGAVASLVLPAAGQLALWPVGVLLRVFDLSLSVIRRLPFSMWICGRPMQLQIVGYYVLMMAVLWMIRTEKHRSVKKAGKIVLVAAFVVLFLHKVPIIQQWTQHGLAFTLTALDVGQGDALILRRFGGAVFLVDGGSSSQKEPGMYCILPYLKRQGIGKIDAIFVTHMDIDHMNGVEEILHAVKTRTTSVQVGALMLPAWAAADEQGKKLASFAEQAGVRVQYLAAGDRINAGRLQMRVLFPPQGSEGMQLSGNEGSLVLHVSYGIFDALLTGDLEGGGEEQVTEYVSDIDCLKVAHHGSRFSTSNAFLAAGKPEIALISAGNGNLYGHPHQETLERLKASGARILQTITDGAITVGTDGTHIRFHTHR